MIWHTACANATLFFFVCRRLGVCPFGYTCGDAFMANCTELRETARDGFKIGKWCGSFVWKIRRKRPTKQKSHNDCSLLF